MGLLTVGLIAFWLVTERARERLNAAVTRSEERFRSLVQNSSDVAILVDDRGDVVYAAPSIRRLIGRDPSDVVGRPLARLAT